MSSNSQPLSGSTFTPFQRVSLNSSLTNLILDSDSSNSSLVVRTGANTSLYIDKFSNVGINTASPGAQLEVASPAGECLRLRYGTSSTAYANVFMTTTGDLSINSATTGSSITTSSSLNIANHDGSTTGLKLGGTLVAATARQLGYTAVTTAGVAEPSRALVLSATRDINNIQGLTAAQLSGELQTAAQPKITSLGTLTLLVVSGDVAVGGNFTLSGGGSVASSLAYLAGVTNGVAAANKAFIASSDRDINNIRNIGASTLSLGSNTLGSAEAGYLTGITAGTAAISKALVVNSNGDIGSIRNLSAAQLSGQVQTPAQPNITSLGTLSSLSLGTATLTQTEGQYLTSITAGSATNGKALVTSASGDIAGIRNLTASQLSGPLQTPAQPNITSVGTLTSLTVNGLTTVTSTTEASSSTNGALTVSGAVAKSTFIGNDLTVGGNLYVNGTSSVVNSTSVSIQDNTLILNASPIGVNDSGLMINRFQTSNDTGTGSVIADTPNFTTTVASATLTTLTLSNGSTVDNYYQGWWLKVGSQTRKVQSYMGSSKTITVEAVFTTVPLNQVNLYNHAFASFIWNEASKRFYAAYTSKDSSSALTVTDDASLRALDIQSTGQLTATASTDSTATNSGAVVITGGVGIGKSLYVGTGIYGAIQTASQPAITSVSTLDIAGHTGSAGLNLGGALVTASAAQLNYLTGVTPGTSTASRAVVADSANAVQLSTLRIGSSLGDTAMGYLTNAATDAVFRMGKDLTNSMSLLWSASGQYFGFTASGASGPQLVITSSGNVGISTTTPGCRLSLGASATDRVLAITESGTDFYGFGSVSTTSALAHQAKAQHEFYTGSSSISMGTLAATITPTGLVAAQLTGRLQTAAQPNITSIGALSSLTVGSTTVDGTSLGYLVGPSEGTVSGSKVIIASSAKDVAGIRKLGLSGAPDLLKLTNTDATAYVESALVSDTYTLRAGIKGSTNATNPSLAYWNYNGADRILMTSSGDLMIGTTDGGYRVNVGGAVNATSYYMNGASLDTASIAYTSAVTPGTAAPNKAIILDASSNITGVNSLTTAALTVGSTAVSGTQIAYITGVSPGTAANSKALVLSSSGSISGINAIAVASLTIGGVDVSAISSSAYTTNITAGSAAASKALVLDSNSNISGIGSMSMSSVVLGGTALTTTEAAYVSGITAGTVANGKALVASSTGTVAGLTSLGIDGQTLTSKEASYLTAVTAGTASASKALVASAALNLIGLNSLSLNNSNGTAFTAIAPASTWSILTYDTTNNITTGMSTAGMLGTYSNHPLKLSVNNATRVTIATDGKVGIGLTPSSYNLEVNGSFNAASYYANGTLVDPTVLAGTTAGVATNSKALIVGSAGAVSGLSSVSTTTIVVNGSSISTEAAYLAGATLGTVAASKAVVADATGQVSGFANVGTTKLTLGGTALTATEAGYLSGAILGSAASGKVVIPNASGDVSGLRTLSLSGTVGDLLSLTNTTSSGYVAQSMTSDTFALTMGVRGSTNTTNPNMAYLYYNNAYRLLINGSGEVMIGTSTGGYRLNVGGAVNATSYNLNGSAVDFSNLGYIMGITKGTGAVGKALVLDDTGKLTSGVVSLATTTLVVNGSSISAEAAYLAGATLGTVMASKAVVADASSQVTGFAKVGTTVLTLSGADLTATHASYLSGATVGAVAASKVVIASAASEISGLSKVTTTTLTVGSTDFTATQAAYLASITAGQVTASKAVVAGSSRDIANIRSLALTNDGVNISMANASTTARTTIQFVGDTKTFELGAAGSANTSYPNNSFYLLDSTASAIRMVVDPSGNVGIGTTTPTTKLTVAGTISATNYYQGGALLDLSLLSATAGTATAGKALILNASKAVDTLSVTGVLTTGGKLSIGDTTASTTSATGALTVAGGVGVAGTVSSSKLTVDGTGTVTTYGGLSNWQSTAVGIASPMIYICYAPELGLYCSVASSGATRGMTSPDGVTWTGRASLGAYTWQSVCWSPELRLFVAVANTGQAVYSPDGVTWTSCSISGNNWIAVVWCSETGLLYSLSSGGIVAYSADGKTFSAIGIPGSGYTCMTYVPATKLILCGRSADIVVYNVTTDNIGSSWINYAGTAGTNWTGICWSADQSLYVAVSSTGTNRIATSTNGTTWTTQSVSVAAASTWRSVCWAAELGLFVAVADSGTNRVITSIDGINWIVRSTASVGWSAICWTPELSRFVGVSSDSSGNVLLSTHVTAPSSISFIKHNGSNVVANTSSIGISGDVWLKYNSGFNGTHLWSSDNSLGRKDLMRLSSQRLQLATSATINGSLTTSGVIKILTTTASTSTTTGALTVAGGVGIGGQLTVGGTTTLNSGLTINNGTTTLNNGLNVSGSATLNSGLNVYNGLTASNLSVSGTTTLNSNLSVTGPATLNSNLSVSGTLTVSSSTTLNNSLYVGGSTNISGNVSLNNSLTVGGTATLNSNLFVSGSATLYNGLSVSGSAALSGNVSVSGFVGIGTQSSYPLQVAYTTNNGSASSYWYYPSNGVTGSSYSTPTSVSIYAAGRLVCNGEVDVISDVRIKENISSIDHDSVSRFIDGITPIRFSYKSENGKPNFGYKAQDVFKQGITELTSFTENEELEEMIDEDGFVSPKGMQLTLITGNMIPLLHVRVKDLTESNKNLEERISNLEQQLEELARFSRHGER